MAGFGVVPRSLYSRAVLVDSGAFVAIAQAADGNHQVARDCLAEMARRALPIFVPVPVVFETYRRLLYGMGPARALAFLTAVYDGSVNLVRLEPSDEERAQAIIRRYEDVSLTLTDAASMSLMERLGIGSVFSFDNDFLVAGFLRVPPLPPPQ